MKFNLRRNLNFRQTPSARRGNASVRSFTKVQRLLPYSQFRPGKLWTIFRNKARIGK